MDEAAGVNRSAAELAQAFLRPGEMPTSAIVVYEFIDTDGEPSLRFQMDADCPSWKAVGMLRVACETYETHAVAALMDEDD